MTRGIDGSSIISEELLERGERHMSMLTRIYGQANIDSSPTAVHSPTEVVSAENLGNRSVTNEEHTLDIEIFDRLRSAFNRDQEINPVSDVDLPAYFRALDQIKSAFGDMHDRLKASHEARVISSADALQHMSALHKLEDELSEAKHVAEIATLQIAELTERLAQEVDRSAALEQLAQNSEREFQSVSARNHELEALLRKMHQGLLEAFVNAKPT